MPDGTGWSDGLPKLTLPELPGDRSFELAYQPSFQAYQWIEARNVEPDGTAVINRSAGLFAYTDMPLPAADGPPPD